MFIALALCMVLAVAPVTAVWENGNWVESSEANRDAVTGVDSKYKATELYTQPQKEALLTGTIKVIVRSGYNTLTPEIGIRNDANPDGVNGTFKFYPIQPDGIAEIEVIPGKFTLYIPNSNGGQDEFAYDVTVAGGKVTPVAMLGHAVSGAIGIRRMSVTTNIDGCDVYLNGLKVVKDELINVPESTKTVCKRVKIIDQPYVPAVPGIAEIGHWVTVIDVPATPAVPAVTHQDYEAGHVHAKKVNGWGAPHDFIYNGHKYQIVGSSHEDAFIVYSYTNARRANMVTIIDVPAKPAVPAVTHQQWVVDVPAVPAVPAIQERSHYETQCREVIVPAYSYWTYKLEGRVTVKSIDTAITNPNNVPLTGHVTVVVEYTVDHNFGHFFDTDTDLEDKTKTFVGTFTSVPGGTTFYDGNIVFSDRINDAIIDDEHFPYVESSSITTDLPLGYYFLN
jgi:hypothetical protein